MVAPHWTYEDSKQARSEGWNIWECDGSEYGRYQLCNCEEDGRFAEDDEAWDFVCRKFIEGSELHKRAIEFLKLENSLEYRGLMRMIEQIKAKDVLARVEGEQ